MYVCNVKEFGEREIWKSFYIIMSKLLQFFLNSEHTILPHPQQNVFYIAETIEATRQNLLNSPTPSLESYCIHANTLSASLLL